MRFDQIWLTIAQDLKQSIIRGELKPGERLKVNELAERYGVSNTPIREAFRYLGNLDFVENIPRKMVVIKGLSLKEIEDIYVVQIELEGLAARLAAKNVSTEDLEVLEENVRMMKRSCDLGDMDQYMALNGKFHELFAKFSRNERLRRSIANTRDHIERFRYLILGYPGKPRESLKQHQQILVALKAGDAQRSEKEVQNHVQIGYEVLINILKNENSQELSSR